MTLLPDPASVSVIANGTGNTVGSSLARLGHSSHSNVRHHSVSDSMFSSAELNSLGHEEYSDEPRSWRRSRRSEESFIWKIDRGEFTENCQSNSISVSGSGSLIANGNGNTVASSLARLCHSSHSNVRHHSVNSRKIASLTQYPFPVCSWCATVFCKTQQFHGKSWRRSRHSEKRFNNKSQIHSFLTTISYMNSFLYAFQSYVMYCFFSIKKLKSAIWQAELISRFIQRIPVLRCSDGGRLENLGRRVVSIICLL